MKYLAIIAAGLSGVFMALQGVFNSELSEKVGLFKGNFYIHLIALTLALVLLLAFPHPVSREKPKLLDFLGGVLAPAIIVLVAYGIAQSGAFKATIAIVSAQTLTAAVVDILGLFGVERKTLGYPEIIGAILMVIGVYLVLRSR